MTALPWQVRRARRKDARKEREGEAGGRPGTSSTASVVEALVTLLQHMQPAPASSVLADYCLIASGSRLQIRTSDHRLLNLESKLRSLACSLPSKIG